MPGSAAQGGDVIPAALQTWSRPACSRPCAKVSCSCHSSYPGPIMAEHFKVRVSKDQLGFYAGHFITYEGDRCERLHGHNYRTAVELEAPLDPNFYVFDFIALKTATKSVTDTLDHRMLL